MMAESVSSPAPVILVMNAAIKAFNWPKIGSTTYWFKMKTASTVIPGMRNIGFIAWKFGDSLIFWFKKRAK